MVDITSFANLSDLVASGSIRANDGLEKCGTALGHFAEALCEVQDMSIDEREETMKALLSWMITNRFGSYARPAIRGFQKFCLAECLDDDPAWPVPLFVQRLVD